MRGAYALDALCVKHLKLGKLSKHAQILVGPRQQCGNKTKFVVNNAFPGTYQVVTHAGCVCNEMRALHNRHLIDRSNIKTVAGYFSKMARKVGREFETPMVSPVGYWTIINGYTGPKRATYMRAYENIKDVGFDKRWTYVKMFVKPDKFPLDKAMSKPPRAIQYRTPEYNLLVGRYLKPIEEEFYKLKSPSGYRFVAKGLNNVQRAELLQTISADYDDPVYILLDHVAYDSSITKEHLRATHKFYRRFNKSRFLQQLLKYQLKNKGFTRHGIKYRVDGTRMSGDYDTALGNTYINYIVLRSWLRMCHVRGDIMLDGDDSVVVIERRNMHKLDYDHFQSCGFETTVTVASSIDEVEFCQSRFLPTNPPRFARDPIRALSRLNVSVKDYHGKGWLRYQAGIGMAEMAVNNGVPILYEVGYKLSLLSNSPIYDTEMHYKLQLHQPLPIDDDVRQAFSRAFNIPPALQIKIESEFTPYLRSRPAELIQSYLSLPENATSTTW